MQAIRQEIYWQMKLYVIHRNAAQEEVSKIITHRTRRRDDNDDVRKPWTGRTTTTRNVSYNHYFNEILLGLGDKTSLLTYDQQSEDDENKDQRDR
ncbi:hypothetical protein NECAME_06905 [Necator americanus]|uniref:Uncharacterized protein n=1 Tax=Necator americanus TaxID=51031 RepID=W2TRD4_NECAM|nr:hypothetical protein NECAME_06905 [Necator americanus]ETN84343.1 hypothetical protein NECAME_06905 [Necator americanus]